MASDLPLSLRVFQQLEHASTNNLVVFKHLGPAKDMSDFYHSNGSPAAVSNKKPHWLWQLWIVFLDVFGGWKVIINVHGCSGLFAKMPLSQATHFSSLGGSLRSQVIESTSAAISSLGRAFICMDACMPTTHHTRRHYRHAVGMYVCMYGCMYIMYIRMDACMIMHACMRACLNACVCVCTCMCVCMCVRV